MKWKPEHQNLSNAIAKGDFIRSMSFWGFTNLIHSTNTYQGHMWSSPFQGPVTPGLRVPFPVCRDLEISVKDMLLDLKIRGSVSLLKQKINGNHDRPDSTPTPVGASKIMHLISAIRYQAQNHSSLKCLRWEWLPSKAFCHRDVTNASYKSN